MATCNWRYGRRTYVETRVATAKAVDVGVAVGVASDVAIVPSDQAWDTSLAVTQANFAALFVGVSDQTKTANVARITGNSEDNVIRCVYGADDVYDITIESATVATGDWFGPSKDTGNALINTSFVKVAGATQGIFQAVRSSQGVAVTTARVAVRSGKLAASR